ncbi:MAG: sensor histidine kinase [Lachnospiraceae bacterium]|uniref:sensor histidine kinase n=1 Tax=Parablautia sp. Marseille-Q6255 TaxID=3039593 RepID=UPI0024BD1DDA|nr:HAMP domain-containing sensor histidine kinase [Parablautia sp. Marseille-Q6255]
MKRKLLGSCIGAYLIFLIGSFLAALYLTPRLVKNYLPELPAAAQHAQEWGAHFIALQNVCYLLLCVVFVLSLIPVAVFVLKFYRPLEQIARTAASYTEKRTLAPAYTYDADNELGRLAASINYLAASVHSSEESQRKFISNISHDFRSPLTSIKGYVEAMLDGTIPPQMQETYLNIVLEETKRLNRLTEGLLTLNAFDDHGVYLQMTDFNIVPVIQSVAASFEGTCQKKNLSLETSFSGASVNVHADIDKIQQVLYNLVDNAIKFSPSGSSIAIRATAEKNLVFISVKDHGEGIEKEELPKIWERFYKSDASRGKDKKGTGLGLSIVKEILRAHDQNISVVSTKGVGTEFIFSLARVKSLSS